MIKDDVKEREVGVVLHILPLILILLHFLYKKYILNLITPRSDKITTFNSSHSNYQSCFLDSFEEQFNALIGNFLSLRDCFSLFHILYESFNCYLLIKIENYQLKAYKPRQGYSYLVGNISNRRTSRISSITNVDVHLNKINKINNAT